MSTDQKTGNRVCPVCRSENEITAFLCVVCHNDLTFTAISSAPGLIEQPIRSTTTIKSEARVCEGGHEMPPGDMFCLECGLPPARENQEEVRDEQETSPISPLLTCGHLTVELPESLGDLEFHSECREGVHVRIFPRGMEPDASLQDKFRLLESVHVARLIAAGRTEEDPARNFEIRERALELQSLAQANGDFTENPVFLEEAARQLSKGISDLHREGILHRDLNRETVFWRPPGEDKSIQFLIGELSQAAIADLGISREPTRITPAFLAPEAVVGVYEEASDWWSLGALLLDLLIGNDDPVKLRDHTILLNVVTRGIPVPSDLPGVWSHLLKGLLTRDPRNRWTGSEVVRWLDGERGIPIFYETDAGNRDRGEPLKIGSEPAFSPEQWALAGADVRHWNEARQQLESGELGTWLDNREDVEPEIVRQVDRLRRDETLSPDERLATVIVFLNPRLPLSFCGELVNPRWLMEHVETALEWMSNEFVNRLRRVERIDWLVDMRGRRDRAEVLAREKSIQLDGDTFRAASLVADDHQLQNRWGRRRTNFPAAHHSGLATLTEKDRPLPEELLILLSAKIEQFTPADEILAEAAKEAERIGAGFFEVETAREWFRKSHREIYRTLNARLSGFVRCEEERLDEWADEFRFERRLSAARALILLQVPTDNWRIPPQQEYLGNLFEFFHRKILRGIQRGPLLQLRVSKNSRNIDLIELGGPQLSIETMLERIFSRESNLSQIDPAVFVTEPLVDRRIRRLHRVGVDYQRDTGIDSVYLGFPFLLFRPKASSPSAKPKRAPLFLWPLEIHASGGQRGRVRLGYDIARAGDEFESGGVELNPALQTLLKQDEITALEEAVVEGCARSRLTAADFFELCAAALPNKISHESTLCRIPGEAPEMRHGEGHLFACGAIFLCDFSQQTIAKDIRQLRNRGLKSGALARALRTQIDAETPSPVSPAATEVDKFFVLAADPSQQRAVLEARRDEGVVIQGPPGTGKSQTIVNILADCIGRGEKVLVVCQKHAALEVVEKRMAEEGLGDRFFKIEDAQRSRKPIIQALRRQTEASAGWRAGSRNDNRDEIAAGIERLEAELCSSADAIQREVEPSRLTYAEILDQIIESQALPRITAFDLREPLGRLSTEEIRTLSNSVGPLVSLWYRSHYFQSPWHGLQHFSPDAEALAEFEKSLSSFVAAEKCRNAMFSKGGQIFQILEPAAMRSWMESHREELSSFPQEVVADAHRWKDFFAAHGSGESQTFLAELKSLASESAELKTPKRQHDLGKSITALSVSGFKKLSKASALVRSSSKILFKRLLPPYLLAKRALTKFGDEHSEFDDGNDIADLHSQIDWETERRKLVVRLRYLSSNLGESDFELNDSLPSGIGREALTLIDRLEAAEKAVRVRFACPVPEILGAAFANHSPTALSDFLAASEVSLQYSDTCHDCLAALKGLEIWFDQSWIVEKKRQINEAVASSDEVAAMADSIHVIPDFQRFRSRYESLPQMDQFVLGAFEKHRGEFSQIPEAHLQEIVTNTIHREALQAWKGLAESRSPALLMAPNEFESKVHALKSATDRFRENTADRLRRPWIPNIIANATSWLEILKITGANARRLREVFDQGIDRGLFNLRPVWLASPETVSRVFPLRENLFDVVIFDEASQIPVELAIPSLYRAKRAVISGDRKQLPPTNFFQNSFDDDDENDPDDIMIENGTYLDADDDTRQRLESKINRRDVKDCSDLLELADHEMPSRLLTIHYRSRWRHLIAFSNHAFYEGKLSVPVHSPDERILEHQPIEVVHVDTPYQSQINDGEANAVVEFLAEHWTQQAPPSVGVVTFNLKQAELIQDKIEERMAADPAFQKNCERERQRPELDIYFVRNLENVQGDERDIIVFSTTFGPDEKGRFLRNFGPASQQNGQRRLNVAVTRSRDKMVIFTSMPIPAIAEGLPGEGDSPREILKAYLSFADAISNGNFEAAKGILSRVQGRAHHAHDRSAFAPVEVQRAFVRSVTDFLKESGFSPKPDDAHDAFHVDLVLVDPQTGKFGLGIECDPPIHADLDSARAREIWRRETLRGSIPNVIRLSSRAWIDDPETERNRLLAAATPFKK